MRNYDAGFYPILPRCKETLECLILANYTARKFDSVPGNNHKPYLQKKVIFKVIESLVDY